MVSLPARLGNTAAHQQYLRDPNGPQATFASESFMDELAAAANADPFDFRMKLLAASAEMTITGSSAPARSRA